MAVQVDQARRHEFARGVDGLGRARRWNVGLDRLDHAPANTDVAFSPQGLAGVEHVSALDDEIELVVRSHRRVGRTCEAPDTIAAAADPVSPRKLRREIPPWRRPPIRLLCVNHAPGSALRKPRRRAFIHPLASLQVTAAAEEPGADWRVEQAPASCPACLEFESVVAISNAIIHAAKAHSRRITGCRRTTS